MVTRDDVVRMRAQLFFEGPDERRRVSRFWMLLVLSAVIAAAGVAGDSTATVIGAMIVAPLMAPILGIVLGLVLDDRTNLVRCLLTVVAAVLAVIAIGYLLGLAVAEPVTAATNAQVAGRVSPKLLDLLAALATGVVGSVALVRSDISDTLPGVAIAISLVPPLAVVGLTLESGEPSEARGAALLFLANVSAILATAVLTMALHGLLPSHESRRGQQVRWRRPGVIVIGLLAVVVAVPLAATSVQIARSTSAQQTVSRVVEDWVRDGGGGSVVSVSPTSDGFTARVLTGATPPDTDALDRALADAGVTATVHLELVPETRVSVVPGT